MKPETPYSTWDYNFAVYLLNMGGKYKETIRPSDDNKKCTFVIDIPEDLDFSEILKKWHSEESDAFRRVLTVSRFLKSEVKRACNNPAFWE